MTLMNTETGEIVQQMTEADAHRLTERIRIAASNYTEAKAKVLRLVGEAKSGCAHVALGYKSWTAYLSDVLSDEPLRLAREDRRELVGKLADEGMTTRAIAPIVGATHSTVQADLREPTGRNLPVDPNAPKPEPTARTTTGLDGRERTNPTPQSAPRAAPRRALPDQFFTAAYDAIKKVESLHRLIGDDRFHQNAEKVAAKHRNDLLRARDLFEQVINALPSEESTND